MLQYSIPLTTLGYHARSGVENILRIADALLPEFEARIPFIQMLLSKQNFMKSIGPDPSLEPGFDPSLCIIGGEWITSTTGETLELGGKSRQLVFDDADVDAALPFLVNADIQNAGQTGSASSRILVQNDICDDVVSKMAAHYEELRVGPAMDDLDAGVANIWTSEIHCRRVN